MLINALKFIIFKIEALFHSVVIVFFVHEAIDMRKTSNNLVAIIVNAYYFRKFIIVWVIIGTTHKAKKRK